MEYLLYSRSSLCHVTTLLLYTGKTSPALSKILTFLYALAGLFFLIDGIRTQGKWLGRLGGLLLLLYAGLNFYWDLNIGLIQSRSIAMSFYFGSRLLGGATLAVLLAIAEPRSLKVVPRVSCIMLLAFNVLAFILLNLEHIRFGIRLYSLINGFLIGVTVVSAIFYWLDQRRLLIKIIPADDTIARLERKAFEWEEQARGEPIPMASRLQEQAKVCREWAAALKTGKWTS